MERRTKRLILVIVVVATVVMAVVLAAWWATQVAVPPPTNDVNPPREFWRKDATTPGSELRDAGPVTGLTFRLSVDPFEPKAERLYMTTDTRLYAFETAPSRLGRNAWGAGNYFDVGSRTITAPPILENLGHFTEGPRADPDILADYELYLGTSDGTLFVLHDTDDPLLGRWATQLDLVGGAITDVAAYNGDLTTTYKPGAGEIPAVLGYPNHVFYSAAAGRWEREVLSSTGDDGQYASLAFDGTGRPILAYYSVWRGQPMVHIRTDQGWEPFSTQALEPYSDTVNVGQYASLAVGTDGFPRMAYYAETEGELKYTQWNGTAWNTLVSRTGGVGAYASLALDALDLPRIAYYNATAYDLEYTSFDGTMWRNETVDGSERVGQYASLALDATGNARIAYYDATNRSLRYVAQTGGVWQSPEFVDKGDDVGQFASLAVDGSGTPHVAYYDATNRSLRYATKSGPKWTVQTVDATNDTGRYASIALDPTGKPAIAYSDATARTLKYARWTGTQWAVPQVVSGSFIGEYNSLKFDAAGNPHVGTYSFQTGRTIRDMLVVGTESGKVYGVDLAFPRVIHLGYPDERVQQVESWDYRVRWVQDLGSAVHLAGSPMVGPTGVPLYSPAFSWNGTVVYVGLSSGEVVAINTTSAAVAWRRTIPGGAWGSAPVGYRDDRTDEDRVLVGGDDGTVSVFTANGELLGSRQVASSAIRNPIPSGGDAYVATAAGETLRIRLGDPGSSLFLSEAWKGRIAGTPTGAFLDENVLLEFVADETGRLHSFRLDGSVNYRVKLCDRITAGPVVWRPPSSLDDNVWVGCRDGTVVAVSA